MSTEAEAINPVKKDLKILLSGRPVADYQPSAEEVAAHKARTNDKLLFRFPPEPNGFLHIGHAKSMNLNFGSALANGGQCYLRYDDTNPATEDVQFTAAIEEMARWMGWKPWKVTYSSDYFQELYDLAIKLIKDGNAYVCHSTAAEVKKQREDRTNSPHRDRSIEENLREFEKMRTGRYAESEATLRVKCDMQHDNPNMRDFIAYRVVYHPHHHVGDKWCIYPSYDYTHCIVDSLEDIDFSLCTLEFETRRESYFWLLHVLGMWKPNVWEFSRLNVTGSLLSKRKINTLVRRGVVRGFDDPRLLTLAGMRRRGYTPEAINKFCDLVGITRSNNVISIKMLENSLREDLDEKCPRRQLVADPIKLVIDNWPAGETKTYKCPEHPRKPELGERDVEMCGEIYIDRSDFHEVDDNTKFYGIAPGPRPVGLKYGGNLYCKSFEKDASGNPTVIHCDIDFDRKEKPKTNITWVSCHKAVGAECRQYTYLLNDDQAAIADDFMQYVNTSSEIITQGFVEAVVKSNTVFDKFQAERFGYYVVDSDTTPDHLVLNCIISLKEDKEKVAAPPRVSNKKK